MDRDETRSGNDRGKPATLFEALAGGARRHPDAIAVVDAAGALTYGALHALVVAAAHQLSARGLRAGDGIAVQLPNDRAFVITLLAAGVLGASIQMLHMPYRKAELAALIRHGKPKAFIGLDAFKDETPIATVAGFGSVDIVLAADELLAAALAGAAKGPGAGDRPGGAGGFDVVGPDSRFVLLHTSGTTADPKGVPVSHRQYIGNALAALDPLKIEATDVLLPAAPFTHLYGLFVLELALLAGASVSLMPAFTPAALSERLLKDRVSAVFAGPAHVRPILADPDAARRAFAGLRLVCLSGTAVAPALAAEVECCLADGAIRGSTRGSTPGVVIQLWGMSELQAGSYGRPDDPVALRHRTAGRPAPGVEFRIRSIESGGDVTTPDVEGLLQVRSPALFAGYLDDPAATARAFDDGWFDTGDTGLLTADGALVLTGRVKEIINRGGVKFNPVDVEALIDSMPGVACCAIVPMPDPVLGERACVFIQPSSGSPPTLEAIVAMLDAAGIARFKWPERVECIDEMPMTPTRKVMRGRLAARLT